MRVYKAILDNDFNVLSYEEAKEKETIFSFKKQDSFDVELSIIEEYLQFGGFFTTYLKKDSEEDFVMYINLDHQFHTIWDNDTSIHVMNQIKQKEREAIWLQIEEQGIKSDNFEGYISTFPPIQGLSDFKKGENIHLKHPVKNGLWSSSDENVAEIDRHTGMLKTKKIGNTVIAYVVDTGMGLANVFKKIHVI